MRYGRSLSSSRKVRAGLLTAAIAGLGFVSAPANAALNYWDGVTGNWSDVANWSTVPGATVPDPASVPGAADDAIFNIDDVAPCDRPRLNCGQTVSFELVVGPDGHAAKQIRIDTTTLPPGPDEKHASKGWR